jgi:hypothetical protein
MRSKATAAESGQGKEDGRIGRLSGQRISEFGKRVELCFSEILRDINPLGGPHPTRMNVKRKMEVCQLESST